MTESERFDLEPQPLPIGQTSHGESVLSNAVSGDAKISICVPTWKDPAEALLAGLIRMPDAKNCTLLVFDDGSGDPELTRALGQQILRFPGPARLITAAQNAGRSHARNRLTEMAETDWILLLDADMQPDDGEFLARYLKAAANAQGPALIAGGFSLKHVLPTQETRLHAAQSVKSECLEASVRSQAPGRYVFTSNILVHRDILDTVKFDDSFSGWGWEDVDWGLRIGEQYPISHIENAATHLGLDTDANLMRKYAQSGENFAKTVARHPQAMQKTSLYKVAQTVRNLRVAGAAELIAKTLAHQTWMPMSLRLTALKLFRASIYAKAMK